MTDHLVQADAPRGEPGPERAPTPGTWKDWAPLGLWAAGLLALLRFGVLVLQARRSAGPGAELDRLLWELGGEYPGILSQALVVGLACAALLSSARSETGHNLPPVPFAFTALLFWSVLSGWPLAPPIQRCGLTGEIALDDALVQGPIAVALAVLFAFGCTLAARPGPGSLLRGIPALIAAVLVAALVPAFAAQRLASRPPTLERRAIARDLVEDLADFDVLEAHPDHPPSPSTITPIVAWETDSGDKPSIRMTPPCAIEITVPDGDPAEPLVLRAAAGIDKRFYNRVTALGRNVDVEFTIEVNGEVRFAETITCEPHVKGVWDPSKQVWHHAGGPQGLPVNANDRLTFRTHFTSDTRGLDPADMNLGFGEPLLERTVHAEPTRATAQSPNIVLIVMDTLRADRMGCYGYERPTTPHIDLLASRGIQFENAYATSSWTWPSTASILTGLAPDAHGVTSNESCTLVRSLESLPEALQDEGFVTGAFSCNPLVAPERYFDQGFDTFEGTPREFLTSEEVAPKILAWLEDVRAMRFFLYLHLADPHTPHRPHEKEAERLGLVTPDDLPERGMGHYEEALTRADGSREAVDELVPGAHQRWIRDVYDASVASGDRYVGEFLKHLADLGLADRTIVAFTADHGEELLDRGRLGHGHGLAPELVHVPLILAGPGIPAGRRDGTVVSNRHLGPTLATLAGGTLRDCRDALFLPDLNVADPSAFLQTTKGLWGDARGQSLYGLRSGDWFLEVRLPQQGEGDLRLFQVEDDPQQAFDLGAEQPERAAKMLAELKARLEAQRESAPEHRVGAGARAEQNLHGLGYGGDAREDS